jgi:hypothetical protein
MQLEYKRTETAEEYSKGKLVERLQCYSSLVPRLCGQGISVAVIAATRERGIGH